VKGSGTGEDVLATKGNLWVLLLED